MNLYGKNSTFGITMKKSLVLLAALVHFSLPTDANASCCCNPTKCPGGNFYIAGFGGYNWTAKNGFAVPRNPVPSSTRQQDNTSPQPHINQRRWKPGYDVGGSFGYRWNNGFRIEAEGSFRYNERKERKKTKGNHQTGGALANALYQFNIWCLPVDMFFGAGLGYVNCFHKDHGHADNKRDGFAWQLIGGLSFPFWERFEFTLDYRYFTEQRAKYRNNAVNAGLRFNL
jgi:opacity protein-like surface antigen